MRFQSTPPHIRIPILLLSILTIGPVIALLIFFHYQQLRLSQQTALSQLKSLTHQAVLEHSRITEAARQLLISLSISPYITNTAHCHTYLASLQANYQRYANFGVINPAGQLTCSAVSTPNTIDLSQRFSFQRAFVSQQFTLGEYHVSPITHKPSFTFAYPLPDHRGVVFASLDLSWLADLIQSSQLGPDTVLVIFDHKGAILSRYPNPETWIGSTFSSSLITRPFTSGEIQETSGIDGITRLYAFESLSNSSKGPFIAIGASSSRVLGPAQSNFVLNLIITSVISLFSLAVGFLISNLLITNLLTAQAKIETLKKDFVSLVSHQIRTPLTSIKYLGDILLSQAPGKLTPKQQEFLTDISSSTRQLIGLVSQMLKITRLESGKVPLFQEPTHLSQIVSESLTNLSHLLRQKRIKIDKRLISKKGVVQVDPKLTRLVIDNLLSNALKYSYPDSTITISQQISQHQLLTSVSNTGPGITPLDQPHIFSKFYRSKFLTAQFVEGTGLGLYLSKLIVEIHGGKIWFTSSPRLTTFTFSLPLHTFSN